MQVQQQISSSIKNGIRYSTVSLANVTIEQIYQVDTITLEQLVEEFESRNLTSIDILASQQRHNQQQFVFSNLSYRQIKKWYQLALIQLQQRKKIQQFALKLICQEIQIDYSPKIEFHKNNDLYNRIQFKQKRQQNQPIVLQKEDINLKLPPIHNSRSSSQSKLQKVIYKEETVLEKTKQFLKKEKCFQETKTLSIKSNKDQKQLKGSNSKSKLKAVENAQSSVSSRKTLNQNLINSKTIQIQIEKKKESKILSKKQFLQMMRIKLNQGTAKDYKTGAFIKQSSTNSIQQNKSIKTIERAHQNSSSNFSSRNKTKSAYINNAKSQNQSRYEPYDTKYSNNSSTISVGSIKNEKQRYKRNSAYTARNEDSSKALKRINESQKFKAQAIQVPGKKVQQPQLLKSNTKVQGMTYTDIKEQRKTSQTLTSQKETLLFIQDKQIFKEQSPHENIQQQKISFKSHQQKQNSAFQVLNNNKIENVSEKKQVIQDQTKNVFKQNQDAYDDQPQVLFHRINLHEEMINISIKEINTTPQQKDTELHINHTQSDQKKTVSIGQNNQNEFNQSSKNQPHPQISDIPTTTQNEKEEIDKNETSPDIESSQVEVIQQKDIIMDSHHQKTYPQAQKMTAKHSNIKATENRPSSHVSNRNTGKSHIAKTQNLLLQNQLSLAAAPNYPSYHLQFPTFTHLFHNPETNNFGKNNKFSFPHLLKSIQYSLETYFQKNVNKVAKQHMSHKIQLINEGGSSGQTPENNAEQNIQVKMITQLQFLQKTESQNIFDIDLTSFKQKSFKLLKKLRNQLNDEFYQRKIDRKQKQSDSLFYRVVKNKPEVYDIINTSFYRTQKWLELPHGMQLQACWNLLWTWSKPQVDFNSLIKFQKVNHFVGSKEIARKDLLKKNIQKIKKMSKKLNELFDIIPQTFFLPGQNIQFIKKFRQSQRQFKNIWILKPVGLSRGRGIQLINKLQNVVFSEPIVMQKYIHNPFLLDGFKFDLRIYVLVTSINPLECFVYKEGFARVSTQRYCNDVEEIDNKYVHLTNYSIQKDSQKSPSMFTQSEKQLGGCKLTLRMLRNRFESKGINWSTIWAQIEDVIIKSLIACMRHIPQNPNCFQLFGYDIMLDSNLKCWLIEVNSSPSLQKDFLIDQIIKQQLVDDIIEVVDPVEFNRYQLLKVIKRRRKQFQGLKSHVNYSNNSIEQLNEDLFHILNGKVLRNYGQIKEHKNFKCIAPSDTYDKILKTVQHYTHDSFVKGTNFY